MHSGHDVQPNGCDRLPPRRSQPRDQRGGLRRRPSPRGLVVLSAVLFFALARGAINAIIFAGWEFPPSRAR
jgi:hypothetical protein